MVNDYLATVWREGCREQWKSLFSASGAVQSKSISLEQSGIRPLDV